MILILICIILTHAFVWVQEYDLIGALLCLHPLVALTILSQQLQRYVGAVCHTCVVCHVCGLTSFSYRPYGPFMCWAWGRIVSSNRTCVLAKGYRGNRTQLQLSLSVLPVLVLPHSSSAALNPSTQLSIIIIFPRSPFPQVLGYYTVT